jgi:membrane fusion protein, multidrug efflux system
MKLSQKAGIAGLSLVLLVLVCVPGCHRGQAKAKEQNKDNKDQAILVEVATIARGPIESTIKYSTYLEAEEEVRVLARTSNRVAELLVEEGDEVSQGDILLRLDDDVQKTAFAKAQVRFEKARQEFERQKSLFEQKLVSEQAFNDTQFEFRQLELALEDARRELDHTEVRAPISGTVSRRLARKGDLIAVNQHLFDIVDFNSIVALIHVSERNLPDLRLDLPARVVPTALSTTEIAGYVKRIAPIIEIKSGLIKVTVGFPDTSQLRPGMFVIVELVTARRSDAILISKRALVYDGELTYVFRLLPDRKVERVPVEPRISDRFNIEPACSFQEGDEIVIAGQTGLKHGAKVRLPQDAATTREEDHGEKAEKPDRPKQS